PPIVLGGDPGRRCAQPSARDGGPPEPDRALSRRGGAVHVAVDGAGAGSRRGAHLRTLAILSGAKMRVRCTRPRFGSQRLALLRQRADAQDVVDDTEARCQVVAELHAEKADALVVERSRRGKGEVLEACLPGPQRRVAGGELEIEAGQRRSEAV